jgi:hypothetical protein
LYAVGRWEQDSRSHAGQVPDIYSDNAVSAGPGLKLQPRGWNANLSADMTREWNRLRTEEHPKRVETNGRVVLSDYEYWERRRWFADAGGSLGWYGRYRDNVIAYAKLRAGLVAWTDGSFRATMYVPAYGSKDGNRDFFNNFAEVGGGADLSTGGRMSLTLRGEFLRGFYMGIHGRDENPYAKAYNDVRLMLVWSMRLSRDGRAPVKPILDGGAGRFQW